jgi:hypothetical protein
MQSLNDPPPPLHLAAALPETVGYRLKRRLLGPPLITRQLSEERLSYAIVSALTRHQEDYVEAVTSDVWRLE